MISLEIIPLKTKSDISQHFGDVLTLVFGVTGGVLALMGLLSIFVSINSQHLIQKLRELVWGIIALTSYRTFDDGFVVESFREKYWFYKQIFERKKTDFTQIIIYVTCFTLFAVIGTWAYLLNLIITENSWSAKEIFLTKIAMFGGMFILGGFILILAILSNIRLVSRLPSPESILDVNQTSDSGIDSLKLASMTSKLRVYIRYKNERLIHLFIGSPFEFKNMKVDITKDRIREIEKVIIDDKMMQEVMGKWSGSNPSKQDENELPYYWTYIASVKNPMQEENLHVGVHHSIKKEDFDSQNPDHLLVHTFEVIYQNKERSITNNFDVTLGMYNNFDDPELHPGIIEKFDVFPYLFLEKHSKDVS